MMLCHRLTTAVSKRLLKRFCIPTQRNERIRGVPTGCAIQIDINIDFGH